MQYLLRINGQKYSINSIEELASYLQTAQKYDYLELWLEQLNGAALSVLVNKDNAWLMFLREEGDSGFSSRNPDYIGATNAELDFLLSNGQRDKYPTSWCLPTNKALQAVLHFFEHGEKPEWIQWHED